jgi:AraC-like DNA-binding protein
VRPDTATARHRLYLLARVLVARHYRRELTLAVIARSLASSPRQVQRAYAQFGEQTFSEDLLARRMSAAAELLLEQRSIPIADVARLVGYRQAPHFAQAFRRRYGLSPASFRERARSLEVRSRSLARVPTEPTATVAPSPPPLRPLAPLPSRGPSREPRLRAPKNSSS